jgi:hypothetical protein
VSPSHILFVRKEGLGDVEACLAGRASAPRELHASELEQSLGAPFVGLRADQLVIDLRFLMEKSSSYRASSVGLSGSSPFRRRKNHDLTFHQNSNAVRDARGARAPEFWPQGPIPRCTSLGCPGAAVEPLDVPAFELLVVSV